MAAIMKARARRTNSARRACAVRRRLKARQLCVVSLRTVPDPVPLRTPGCAS
jgi:hypothetical protein